MSFYPQGYEPKDPPSDYMRLQPGENRIRILANPIIGYETWIDEDNKRKPIRYKDFNKAVADPRADKIKEFHAFIVWDYASQDVQLLSLTQKTIQKAIFNHATDPDWGDPTRYDIIISKSGKGLETEYNVKMKPSKPMDEAITDAFKQVKIETEEYFNNGHPIVRTKDENGVSDEDALIDTTSDQTIPF